MFFTNPETASFYVFRQQKPYQVAKSHHQQTASHITPKK